MISNIISPIITPIITDILGVGEDEAFSIIINGAPSWYSDYTREDVGYSIGTAGGSVEVPQDVPMYDVSGNDKLYINYADPNEPSGFPSGVNQPALSLLATARLPWLSGTTPFGLTGLFEGVADGADSYQDTYTIDGNITELAGVFTVV